MPLRLLAGTLLLLPALALVACDLATGPGGRRAGVLEWDRSSARRSLAASTGGPAAAAWVPALPAVSVPDTVEAGRPFTVGVRTWGPDYCWQAAGTEVTLGASLAVVTPYDRDTRSADTGCADANVEINHSFELAFPHPGEAVVRVRGRKIVGREFEQEGEPVEVERRVHVRQPLARQGPGTQRGVPVRPAPLARLPRPPPATRPAAPPAACAGTSRGSPTTR